MLNLYQGSDLVNLARQFSIDRNRLLDGDVFRTSNIIVQTSGMERWLSLQLAENDGAVGNLAFTNPKQFLGKLQFLLSGNAEKKTPFDRSAMPWAIYRIIKNSVQIDDGLKGLCEYVKDGDERKLFALSDKIADLFDQYIMYRPEMIRKWKTGSCFLSDNSYEVWQMRLWKLLTEEYSNISNPVTNLESLGKLIDSSDGEAVLHYFSSITLFGMAVLPPNYLELFDILSTKIPVNLYMLNPSEGFYWGDLVSDRESGILKKRLSLKGRKHFQYNLTEGNRLLANLGGAGRDFFDIIYDREPELFFMNDDISEDKNKSSLLNLLKSDIATCRSSRKLDKDSEKKVLPIIKKYDKSISVAVAHSPLREVEILHDELLSLFDKDGIEGIKPRDILVVTPEIEKYAPYIDMVFSTSEHKINYTISDRSYLAENGMAETLKELLLELTGRFGAATVITLFEQFRRHAGMEISSDQISILRKWVEESGIRWGIDAQFRTDHDLPEVSEFSFAFGKQRLLFGYAMAKDSVVENGTIPYCEIEGGATELLGEFIKFTETLFDLEKISHEKRTIYEWSNFLKKFVLKVCCRGNYENSSDELNSLFIIIDNIAENVKLTASENEKIEFTLYRWVVNFAFESSDSAGSFITGGVTFASMVPMRSIPFKVICMIGINHNSFPRRDDHSSFNLLLAKKRKGDRNIRERDLYLFLELLLSAKDKFYISYTGRSIKDNSTIPPSSVIDILMDYISCEYEFEVGSVDAQLVKEYPLQPFSKKFGDKSFSSPFTYNSKWFNGEKIADKSSPFSWKLQIQDEIDDDNKKIEIIDADRLKFFFRDPGKWFMEKCAGVCFPERESEIEELEPFDIDNFTKYSIKSSVLSSMLGGAADNLEELNASGMIPTGLSGKILDEYEIKKAEKMASKVEGVLLAPKPFNFKMDEVIDGIRFIINDYSFFESNAIFLMPITATIKTKYRTDWWINHLFLNLKKPTKSIFICEPDNKTFYLDPLNKDIAFQKLFNLNKYLIEGEKRLLPIFPEACWEFVSKVDKKGEEFALAQANKKIFKKEFALFSQEPDNYKKIITDGYNSLEEAGVKEEFVTLSNTIFGDINGAIKKGEN